MKQEENTRNELLTSMKEALQTFAVNILGKQRKKASKAWITEESLKLIDKRRSLMRHNKQQHRIN